MKKIFYILFAAVVLAAACTREMAPEQSVRHTTSVAPKDGDMALVTFKVTVPETSLYATQTRAQHQIKEQPSIENGDLFVAVFGGGDDEKIGGQLQHFLKAKLAETIEHDVDMTTTSTTTVDPETGENVTVETTTRAYTYVYEVLVPISKDPLVFEFMVGACDKAGKLYTLENPLPVEYEATLMPKLFSLNGNAAYWQRIRVNRVSPKVGADGKYVMTDYKDDGGAMLPDVDQDYVAEDIPAFDNVQLIRNFAKVTFTSGENAPFVVNRFYLLDTPVSGSVAPYSTSAGYNTVYTTATSAGAVMGSYEGYVNSKVLSEGIKGKKFLNAGVFDYMYERSVPSYSTNFKESGAMLEVTWKDDIEDESLSGTTRYYKVAFMGPDGYLPILRNIEYNFEMENIVSEQHPTTPEDAYAGQWLGDISANIATAMLDELSNSKSSIKVSRMACSAIGENKDFDIDFYFYPEASNTNNVVVTNGAKTTIGGQEKTVTISVTAMKDGGDGQAINSFSTTIVPKGTGTNAPDDHATVHVKLNSSQTGIVLKGKLRILGQVEGRTALYRDVLFTVMEKQDFVSAEGTQCSVTPLAVDNMDQDVTVTFCLPDALPRDIFPLKIKIEAENNCLYSVADTEADPEISALPVQSGPSTFVSGKHGYFFVKTITYDEYAILNGLTYDYTGSFQCKFKTRLPAGQNHTTIHINDLNEEYFNQKPVELKVGS